MNRLFFALGAVLFLIASPVLAQWQTPQYSIPIGKGTGKTGFNSVGPCATGTLVGGTGTASDPTCQSFIQSGTGAQSRSWASKVRETVSVTDFATCAGDDGVDDSIGINAAITRLNAMKGGQLVFPAGVDCRLKNPIIIKEGVYLVGPGRVVNSGVTGATGAIIRPAANVASLVTQSDLSASLHSVGIVGLTFDGRKASFAVGALIELAPINSLFRDNFLINGSGACLYLRNISALTAWINDVSANSLISCDTYGAHIEITDSVIAHNYISSNGTAGVRLNTYGALNIIGNHIELSPTGVEIVTPAAGCVANLTTGTMVGNHFDLNGTALVFTKGACSGAARAAWPITGNVFSNSTTNDVSIASNITGGALAANSWRTPPTGAHVTWGGSNNTGWSVGGDMTKSAATRFANLPADAQVQTSGDALYNRISLQDTLKVISAQNAPTEVRVENGHGGASTQAKFTAVTDLGVVTLTGAGSGAGGYANLQSTMPGIFYVDAHSATAKFMFRTGATPSSALSISENQQVTAEATTAATTTTDGALRSNGGLSVAGAGVFGGDIKTSGVFASGSSSGLSATKTVRNAAGTGTCTLIFTGGILTGGTC